MSTLLDEIVAAHGGLARWNEISEVSVELVNHGALFERKGYPPSGKASTVLIKAHTPHTERWPFKRLGLRSVFEPDRVAVLTDDGEVVSERREPRAAFAGHTMDTPWDDLHLTYFGGYANWQYLTTPFLFTMPGFVVDEIEPWEEEGETWRRLSVTFPDHVPSHSTVEVFYFGPDLMLRRQDYDTHFMGGGEAANYASDYQAFDGIRLPMTRRIHPRGPDNHPIRDVLGVALDMTSPRAL